MFDDFLNALEEDEFEEKPVDVETFIEDYLSLPPLSQNQYTVIKAGTQIFREDTLISLYGYEEGTKRFKQTFNEVVLQLGKGSGKDFMSTIICAYVVYQLLCLKDPATYFGKPSGDAIDILNIAINSDQAKNVFFKNFKKRIKGCEWFDGKYTETQASMEFDNAVTVYSGHSEREAFEGLNLIIAVLDEISGFSLTSASDQGKTADAIYRMYRASVDSRFADFGKVLLLSFPRFENDYIQQRYDDVVATKEVLKRSRVLKRDPELPDNTEGNEFTIEWDEDHITRYKYPKVFALRRPTWEVNPTFSLDAPANIRAFDSNLVDALGRFACMPRKHADDSYFKNHQAIDDAFVLTNGVDQDGIFSNNFKPKKDVKYYIHVDLAQKNDHCAVAMAHVEKWVEVSIGANYKETHPFVIVDALRWWTPTKEKSIDFKVVKEYIVSLKRRGFDIELVTFDRWGSHQIRNDLEREHEIKTDNLSVAKKHYDDFQVSLYDYRIAGPAEELLTTELKMLKQNGDKIDHQRKSTKDLSDATCGAIFDAILHTKKSVQEEVEVHTLADIRKAQMDSRVPDRPGDVIKPPRSSMPNDLSDYMNSLRVI